MTFNRILAGTVVSLLLACPVVAADDIVLESGMAKTSVLELYTSEGCSSCPPADRFMSSLVDHPELWDQLIPVAFHVDYWDYIGWADRFADPAFTARQRDYANANAMRTIYTPGFLLNGAEWRGRSIKELTKNNPAGGKLSAAINSDSVSIGFQAASDGELNDPVANVALLGFGLSSQVNAGENTGRRLSHDFVVLSFEQVPLEQVRGVLTASARLQESEHSAKRHAIAVWVSANGQPHPLQAVGGWIDRPKT